MSRKRKRSKNTNANNSVQNLPKPKRFIIPLSQWKRFESFTKILPQIEDAVQELSEDWESHIDFLSSELMVDRDDLETMCDNVKKLGNLLKSINCEKHTSFVKPKCRYANLIAEIIVEDVSNGEL